MEYSAKDIAKMYMERLREKFGNESFGDQIANYNTIMEIFSESGPEVISEVRELIEKRVSDLEENLKSGSLGGC